MSALLREIVDLHRGQLRGVIEVRGVARLRKLYAESRLELEEKLSRLRRAGKGQTFGAQHLSQVLVQVADAARGFEGSLEGHLRETGRRVGMLAPRHLVSTVAKMEARYGRMTPVVQAAQAAAVAGAFDKVAPTLLSRYRSSARLYGAPAIASIQKRLALSVIQEEPVEDAIDRVAGAHGLFEGQRWRAERITRTELSYSYGLANQEAMMDLRPRIPRMMKRLVATFDDRTGDDSKELNGQTVEVHLPFLWEVTDSRGRKTGKIVRYMQPPNRSNDREVTVPWVEGWAGAAALGPVGAQG